MVKDSSIVKEAIACLDVFAADKGNSWREYAPERLVAFHKSNSWKGSTATGVPNAAPGATGACALPGATVACNRGQPAVSRIDSGTDRTAKVGRRSIHVHPRLDGLHTRELVGGKR